MQNNSTVYSSPITPTLSPISPLSSEPVQNPYKKADVSTNLNTGEEKPTDTKVVNYICGSCGCENPIRPQDAVTCRSCGHKIMYKKRTRRPMQFEAR